MSEPDIKAATLDAGTSKLKFHALNDSGNAACSSDLYVVWIGDLARDIPGNCRCKSRACAKLFAQADAEKAATSQNPRS